MIDAAPRCQGCRCATGAAPVEAAAPPFAAIVAHGQPGDPGALQPELEALAALIVVVALSLAIYGTVDRALARMLRKRGF